MEWFHFDNSDKFFWLREESEFCNKKNRFQKVSLGLNEIKKRLAKKTERSINGNFDAG